MEKSVWLALKEAEAREVQQVCQWTQCHTSIHEWYPIILSAKCGDTPSCVFISRLNSSQNIIKRMYGAIAEVVEHSLGHLNIYGNLSLLLAADSLRHLARWGNTMLPHQVPNRVFAVCVCVCVCAYVHDVSVYLWPFLPGLFYKWVCHIVHNDCSTISLDLLFLLVSGEIYLDGLMAFDPLCYRGYW